MYNSCFSLIQFNLVWQEFCPACLSIGTTNNLKLEQSEQMKWNENSKIKKNLKLENFTNWEQKFEHSTTPFLGNDNLCKPRLYHTVRVTSKLFMEPTIFIASAPQLWLCAVIWGKKCFFILLFIVKFLKLLNIWSFRCLDIYGRIRYVWGIYERIGLAAHVNKSRYWNTLRFTM